MKRGEVWVVAGGGHYLGKPRPAVIVQHERYNLLESIVVCPFTTNLGGPSTFRIPVPATPSNGLREECRLMVDKIAAVPKAKLGACIGSLTAADLARFNRAIIVFLGVN